MRQETVTTLLIVRRGEKQAPNSNAQNEPLSAAGQASATTNSTPCSPRPLIPSRKSRQFASARAFPWKAGPDDGCYNGPMSVALARARIKPDGTHIG